jgi:ribosomal protein S7
MCHENDVSKAEVIFEQAMENVYSKVDDARVAVEELSELVDEFAIESKKEEADELIAKALNSLDKI